MPHAPQHTQHLRLYRAMLARDYRFDGRFFIGVKTTGIYCRPICPARPLQKNVEFFPSALRAEKAGYRPCMRCRPEAAPTSPAWMGASAIVSRALRELPQATGFSEAFANRFGVSARHLNRLFQQEIGKTPKQIRDLNRLGFARKLVAETHLPLIQIAESAGFASVRRFNDAFKNYFGQPPSSLRTSRLRKGDAHPLTLSLAVRPPFDWMGLLDYYASHQIPGVDRVHERGYERVFELQKIRGWFRAEYQTSPPALLVHVHTDAPHRPKILLEICQRVRQMFDLDSDPLGVSEHFAAHFAEAPAVAALFRKYPGLRLTRGWDPFEAAICTVLGQLVSVAQARSLVGALVSHYGEPVALKTTGVPMSFLFPTPARIAASDLRLLRTTGARRRTLIELSRRVLAGPFPHTTDDLRSIPGIGPWSAEYIQLRALGNPDAFPASDLILKRALTEVPELVGIDLEKARPWRGYLAIALWKEYAHRLTRTRRKAKSSIRA